MKSQKDQQPGLRLAKVAVESHTLHRPSPTMSPSDSRVTRGAVRKSSSAGIVMRENPIPAESDTASNHWTAWSRVLVSHLLVVNGFGYLSSFALFESHWVTTLQRSASDVSWVGSFQMFLLFFIRTLSGRAMDAGYFRSLIWSGCGLQLLGVFTTSVCQKYWQLLLSQGVVQGLGNGLLFTPAVTLVSTYFSKNRAVALGIAACGAPIGGIVFPVVCSESGREVCAGTLTFATDRTTADASRWVSMDHKGHGIRHALQFRSYPCPGAAQACIESQRAIDGVERIPGATICAFLYRDFPVPAWSLLCILLCECLRRAAS